MHVLWWGLIRGHSGTRRTYAASYEADCGRLVITLFSDITGENVLEVQREAIVATVDAWLAFGSTDGAADRRVEHKLRETGLTGCCRPSVDQLPYFLGLCNHLNFLWITKSMSRAAILRSKAIFIGADKVNFFSTNYIPIRCYKTSFYISMLCISFANSWGTMQAFMSVSKRPEKSSIPQGNVASCF